MDYVTNILQTTMLSLPASAGADFYERDMQAPVHR
jgi:hypothetical protein